MAVFFTSDWHIGHANIIQYCARPFASVEIMNAALIANYNAMVSDEDTCYFIGDICMGNKTDSLQAIRELKGKKILIAGNHDAVFRISDNVKAQKHQALYLDAGFSEIYDELIIHPENFSTPIRLCHFPYRGADKEDSREFELRYAQYRLDDDGLLLLHGHTHQRERLTGERSVHVGVDAWDFRPVGLGEVISLHPAPDNETSV